jgi:hypothetical protein
MKVKLADGTEVEVDDNSDIAVAARALEQAKGLGFDSLEAYHNSLNTQVDTLTNQQKADQEFINRQKNELGELRKTKEPGEKPEEKPREKTVEDKKTEETAEEREARYAKMNIALNQNLNDEQREHAETQFKEQFDKSTPQQRELLKTEEGRNAFLGLVFPDEKTEQTPITLFSKPKPEALSIGEQVAKALKEDDTGRSRKPVATAADGIAFKPGRKAPAKDKPKFKRPLPRSGGVLDQIQHLEAQEAS